MHRSGFVNIIGRPNAGKSTLMNALVGERMSIITAKPQTTRHRIIGLLSGEDFQIVFSDTPGVIDDPAYKMQEVMNAFVNSTFEDADIMLLVVDMEEAYAADDPLISRLKQLDIPVFLILNKIDLSDQKAVMERIETFSSWLDFAGIYPVSALHKLGTQGLLEAILERLPEGPAYYPKDQLTDRPERFFVSEIIREKILEQYQQEIPYSAEVAVESFKESTTREGEPLVRIQAQIFVMRPTQKSIIIGKGGSAIKQLGTAARQSIEQFLEKKVFLELHVKVRDNWRDNEQQLRRFGYQ
jgi:GTP-binding protein Era